MWDYLMQTCHSKKKKKRERLFSITLEFDLWNFQKDTWKQSQRKDFMHFFFWSKTYIQITFILDPITLEDFREPFRCHLVEIKGLDLKVQLKFCSIHWRFCLKIPKQFWVTVIIFHISWKGYLHLKNHRGFILCFKVSETSWLLWFFFIIWNIRENSLFWLSF